MSAKSLQWCLTLCDPMDCSPPRIPEWVAISSSREFSWLSDRTHISYGSCIGRWVLMPPGKPVYIHAHINRIFIIGMDSRDYGGQGSPMVYCAVWKLEMQGNQGCDSFWVQRVENQRNVSILSLVKLDFPALAEKLFPHSAFFFFLSRPSRDWMMSIHLSEDSLFYSVY